MRLAQFCAGEFSHTNEGPITAWGSIIVAFFTFALWDATKGLWLVSQQQADDLGRSLDNAETAANAAKEQATAATSAALSATESISLSRQSIELSQRPWIRLELGLDESLRFHRPAFYRTTLALKISNIGNTPAFNVWGQATMYPLGFNDFPNYKGRSLQDLQAEFSESNKAPREDVIPITLFPEETRERTLQAVAHVEDSGDMEGDARGRLIQGFAVIGFVKYRFNVIGEGKDHETGIVVGIVRKSFLDPEGGFFVLGECASVEDLHILADQLGSGRVT